MDKYLRLQGSKGKITDDVISLFQLPVSTKDDADAVLEYISCMIDVLDENYEMLSDDEDFQKDTPRSYTAEKGFLVSDAKYYVNIRGSTLAFAMILAEYAVSGAVHPIIQEAVRRILPEFVPGLDAKLVRKLNAAIGESCIMLEAALRGKKGIDQKLFAKNRGECVNNHLWCGFWGEGRCSCTKENVEEICEKLANNGLLVKKGKKYYYQDIF